MGVRMISPSRRLPTVTLLAVIHFVRTWAFRNTTECLTFVLEFKCSFSFVIGDHPPNPQSTGNNESDEKPNLLSSSFEVRVEEEMNIPCLWTGTGAKIAAGPRLAVSLPKESAMLAFLRPGDRIFIVINVEVEGVSGSR
jgi:hypothetical protein